MDVLDSMLNAINTVSVSTLTDKPRMKNKILFSGRVEVQQVCNGYLVQIATREGYEFDSYIASTVKEVNELISTALVAFQLENR